MKNKIIYKVLSKFALYADVYIVRQLVTTVTMNLLREVLLLTAKLSPTALI